MFVFTLSYSDSVSASASPCTLLYTAPFGQPNPFPTQTRHYAESEFPLHFVPKTFHPLKNIERCIYFFPLRKVLVAIIFIAAFLRILLFFLFVEKKKKKNCSSVNEPHTVECFRAFCFIKHRISNCCNVKCRD